MNRRDILRGTIMGLTSLVFPSTSKGDFANWHKEALQYLNEERANADAKELALYGEFVVGPRLPLELDPILTESAQWWCDALKGTGIVAHGWYTNNKGYLIQTPDSTKTLTRVWLPFRELNPGEGIYWTDFLGRNAYQGLLAVNQSENILLTSNVSPESIIARWRSGYNDDPTKALGHYGNMINPLWTHCGFGRGPYGNSKKIAVLDLAAL